MTAQGKMDIESILKQIKMFANNIAILTVDFAKQLEGLESIANEVSGKLIDAKATLKQDLCALQDNLSTIEQKVKDLFDRQDPKDGTSEQ